MVTGIIARLWFGDCFGCGMRLLCDCRYSGVGLSDGLRDSGLDLAVDLRGRGVGLVRDNGLGFTLAVGLTLALGFDAEMAAMLMTGLGIINYRLSDVDCRSTMSQDDEDEERRRQ